MKNRKREYLLRKFDLTTKNSFKQTRSKRRTFRYYIYYTLLAIPVSLGHQTSLLGINLIDQTLVGYLLIQAFLTITISLVLLSLNIATFHNNLVGLRVERELDLSSMGHWHQWLDVHANESPSPLPKIAHHFYGLQNPPPVLIAAYAGFVSLSILSGISTGIALRVMQVEIPLLLSISIGVCLLCYLAGVFLSRIMLSYFPQWEHQLMGESGFVGAKSSWLDRILPDQPLDPPATDTRDVSDG